jgi:toxin ParE1/3/4
MPRILRTRKCRADVVEIVLMVRRDNRRAARRLLKSINDTIELIAAFPAIGPERNELSPGLRSFPVSRYRNYLIFYRIKRDGIEVIRVLHGERDLPQVLADD